MVISYILSGSIIKLQLRHLLSLCKLVGAFDECVYPCLIVIGNYKKLKKNYGLQKAYALSLKVRHVKSSSWELIYLIF